MKILGNRLLVKKCEEEKKEGFTTVEVQDSFVYKGVVVQGGFFSDVFDSEANEDKSTWIGVGDTVVFAKYSPDTHEVDVEGEKMKVIKYEDVIAIL